MKRSRTTETLRLLCLLLPLWLEADPARAATIGFELKPTAPVLKSLISGMTPRGLTSALALKLVFEADGNNGYVCADGSAVKNLPATCTVKPIRVQSGKPTYLFTVRAMDGNDPTTALRFIFSAKATDKRTSVEFSNPTVRLKNVSATTVFTTELPASPTRVVLNVSSLPKKGAITGTGIIDSPYSATRPASALRGSQLGKGIRWALNQGQDRLAFAGRTAGNTWRGKVTGQVGSGPVNQTVAIPLAALQYGLTVRTEGAGSVTSSPAGLNCSGNCTARFPYGSPVTLTATAATGNAFAGWSGDPACAGGAPVMARPRTCVARFEPVQSPGTPTSPTPKTARFHGRVALPGDGKTLPPAENVLVAIRSDLNGDGSIGAGEAATATTGPDGLFDLPFPVDVGRPVTVDFSLKGYSRTPKLFGSIAPGADVPVNTLLVPLAALSPPDGGSAQSTGGDLELQQLPANVAELRGQVFNPIGDTDQFPGEFADSDGNLLVSSVFAMVEAFDTNGQPVKTMGPGTLLRLELPGNTWNTLRDLTPGNGRIDVPLYDYDEAAGQWKRGESDGWIENEDHAILPEDTLAAIRSGEQPGRLFAVGHIAHLSYWNVDWPIDTHGCVTGRVVDSSGNPVAGALVKARGVSYTGTTAGETTDASGHFCVEAMRSEAAGEDMDGNGTAGEKQRIALTVVAGGKSYDFGPYDMPAKAGSCGSADCAQLGDLPLDPGRQVSTNLCTVTGSVVYSGTSNGIDPGLNAGTPIAGANVFAFDPDAQDSLMDCILNNEGCSMSELTGPDGTFSLKVPVLYGLELMAYRQTDTNTWLAGNLGTQSCPREPVTLQVDAIGWQAFISSAGFTMQDVPPAEVLSGTISGPYTFILEPPAGSTSQ